MKYQHLLELIRQKDAATIQEINQKAYPKCRRYVIDKGGTPDDVKDVLQDAMYRFYLKVCRNKELVLTVPPEAFVLVIAKNVWREKVRDHIRGNTYLDLDDEDSKVKEQAAGEDPLPDELLEVEPEHPIVRLMEQLGKDCKRVLVAFYLEKLSLNEIAEELGFSYSYAKLKRLRCTNELRDLYLENN